jgi:Ca2+-binding EF-hand superfamily protein
MASNLTEEEIAKIKTQFLSLDEDGSGELSIDELSSILKDPKLKMTPEDVNHLMTEFDIDGSGTINVCEFLILMSKRKNRKMIHRAIILRTSIRKAFKEMDLDGNGFITRKEFKCVMKKQSAKYTEAQMNAMIKEADTNGDGKIDYDEFVVGMTK